MSTQLRFFPRLVCVLLAAGVLVSIFPQPVRAAQEPEQPKQQCIDRHGVRRGDTLLKLEAQYGISWRKIAAANGITAPWTIYIGQVLCIPGRKGEDPRPGRDTTPKTKAVPLVFRVRVKAGMLTVRTARFPANELYYVRADDAKRPGSLWHRLGLLRTGPLPGYVETSYMLPEELLKATKLEVCLKNAITDDVACTTWKK
jgi:LysM repeat protein